MPQPSHKIRYGALQATIWKNDGEHGTFYTVSPSRSYKQGEEWKETTSLGYDDLLTFSKMLDEAHSWINVEQQADNKARKQAAPAAA